MEIREYKTYNEPEILARNIHARNCFVRKTCRTAKYFYYACVS